MVQDYPKFTARNICNVAKIRDKLICPTYNFNRLAAMFPVSSNAPCFSSSVFPTESVVRKHLSNILSHLNLHPSQHSFHTFHRSGATLAYNLDIDMEKIKRHGTWRSDAVNAYIISDPNVASGVSARFKNFFNSQ